MPKKKEDLLKREKSVELYDLSAQEKAQLAALNELVGQAQAAQDMIFSRIVSDAADRLEISNASLNINMQEVLEKGIDAAKLVVER